MAQIIIDVHCGWGATASATQWNDVANIQAALQKRGVSHVILSSLLARRYDLPTGNDALAAALPPLPDGESETPEVRGWLVAHPARNADSQAQMRKHLNDPRFMGVALYPDPLTGTPVSARDVREIIVSFRRYGKPLLVEATSASGMAEVIRMTEDMAGVKIVASGMGGEEWREAIDMASKSLNLLLDVSGSLAPEKIEYAFAAFHGSRRLLFASGGPQTDPAAVLGLIRDADIPAEDRDRILGGNAARLLRIGTGAIAPVTLMGMGGADDAPPPIPNYMIGNENPSG